MQRIRVGWEVKNWSRARSAAEMLIGGRRLLEHTRLIVTTTIARFTLTLAAIERSKKQLQPGTGGRMSNELKPCPLCGAAYEKDEDDFVYSADHESWCPLRGSAYGGYGLTVGDSEEEIAAWNRRAERTCRNLGKPKGSFLCSACGWGDFAPPGLPLRGAKFCPECGAKVVE